MIAPDIKVGTVEVKREAPSQLSSGPVRNPRMQFSNKSDS